MTATLQKRKSRPRLRRRHDAVVLDGSSYRSLHNLDDGASLGAVQADKPWICTWLNTVLEVIYIYPEQKSNADVLEPSSPPVVRDITEDVSHDSTATLATAKATAKDTTVAGASPASPAAGSLLTACLPSELYPTVFKPKERRGSELGSSAATCRVV